MDAIAYQMSFDEGQLALLCANYDRRIDSLDAENKQLQAENAKLRELAALNWEWAHSCCGTSCKLRTNGCGYGIDRECNYEREIWERMRELGVDG